MKHFKTMLEDIAQCGAAGRGGIAQQSTEQCRNANDV